MKNKKLKNWCIETKNKLEENKTYPEKAFKYYLLKNKINFETQKLIIAKKKNIIIINFFNFNYYL